MDQCTQTEKVQHSHGLKSDEADLTVMMNVSERPYLILSGEESVRILMKIFHIVVILDNNIPFYLCRVPLTVACTILE